MNAEFCASVRAAPLLFHKVAMLKMLWYVPLVSQIARHDNHEHCRRCLELQALSAAEPEYNSYMGRPECMKSCAMRFSRFSHSLASSASLHVDCSAGSCR